jgi:hypothetical protein
MSPNVTSGTYALDSFGTSAISVQMTNPSYQSTDDDDTDIKHVQSTDEDDTDIKLLPGESTYSPFNLYLSDAPRLFHYKHSLYAVSYSVRFQKKINARKVMNR